MIMNNRPITSLIDDPLTSKAYGSWVRVLWDVHQDFAAAEGYRNSNSLGYLKI